MRIKVPTKVVSAKAVAEYIGRSSGKPTPKQLRVFFRSIGHATKLTRQWLFVEWLSMATANYRFRNKQPDVQKLHVNRKYRQKILDHLLEVAMAEV